MSRILTSLHGRRVGIDHNKRLLSQNGFVAGEHGSQFVFPSPDTVAFFDDFIGDLVLDEWGFVEGTDSATSAAAILAGGIGGVLRLTTGDAGTGYAADAEQMNMALQWQASNGGLFLEARLKLSAITTCYAFIGFTDTLSLEAPIVSASSANTLTTNATDAVGFMFDTNMTADTWWLTGVANDVDATAQNTGYAPVADTYAKFRIEISSAGAATFFYNGVLVGTTMTGAVTAATDLTPIITVSKLSVAAAMNLDLDYIALGMQRV
ncbi:MAG: hypothetical protein RL651_1791 [Pseudomonadota bacterium]|jgi:hypothetical protein